MILDAQVHRMRNSIGLCCNSFTDLSDAEKMCFLLSNDAVV